MNFVKYGGHGHSAVSLNLEQLGEIPSTSPWKCGICVGQCPKDAIVLEDKGNAKITPACILCGKCLEVCPLLKF
ncbi:MAG: 4Fe-4S dicluster domain-containing protein [Methanosarcinales archaeon]